MGADEFVDYAEGIDVREAFDEAVEQARCEFGGGGYTGSLAEKDEVIVIDAPVMSYDDAVELARKLVRDSDPRIDDKYGPAGAIAVDVGWRTRRIEFETKRHLDGHAALIAFLVEQVGVEFPGEIMDQRRGWTGCVDDSGGRTRGAVSVWTTGGAAQQTGWIFFGWASS